MRRVRLRDLPGAAAGRVRGPVALAGEERRHVDLRTEQLDDVFDFPLTVTLQYADSKSDDVVVAITERIVTVRLPLAGALRSARISRADGSLAETVGN